MNRFLAVVTLGLPMHGVSFAEEIGKEIRFSTRGGTPAFGVQFVHDRDSAFGVTGTVKGSDLTENGCLSSIAFRFFDSGANSYLTDWEILEYGSRCASIPGAYPIQVSVVDTVSVQALLKRLSRLKLVLAVNFFGTEFKATSFVDLGALCKSAAQGFVDLTTYQTGCPGEPQ